ncbi:MAG: type I restriction-modification system subunit M [Planctomycetaceae bacterium]|nr:type I restriction-modification system subunit M [Planctomycetaceae bacterium]
MARTAKPKTKRRGKPAAAARQSAQADRPPDARPAEQACTAGQASSATPGKNGNGKRLATQQSVDSAIYSICDVMRRGNVASALQYVPELTWILFLRILDETEEREAMQAKVLGHDFTPSIKRPFRWADWARPIDAKAPKSETNQRRELTESGAGKLLEFVNAKLIPYLKGLKSKPDATPRQKVIAEILSGVERVRIDTETNLLEVLDKVHEISQSDIDPTHVFALSQVYEGLLLKMGEKGSDAGQFFTPREVIRTIVRAIDPQVGERVYDPCCGTGGFLAQSAEYMLAKVDSGQPLPKGVSRAAAKETIKHDTFYGREKENLIYPIGLANLILHGIDDPHIWHGNTLTGNETYGGAPTAYEVILANPPFGGKENAKSLVGFDYPTSATEVLFLQTIIRSLASGGRCGLVMPEGVLFRTNEEAFTKTKKKLLEECDLRCIVSLPGGVFTAAGAGVKTNLLFFTRGKPTERIWYYDLSDRKVGKKTPLVAEDFREFFELLPKRTDSERSWTVDFTARRRKATDDARPFRQTEAAKRAEADAARERLSELKRAKPRDEAQIAAAEEELDGRLRAAREAAAKAQAIEDAVYDLKAVNPNKKAQVDTRTPGELLDLIEQKGRDVAKALTALRAMV